MASIDCVASKYSLVVSFVQWPCGDWFEVVNTRQTLFKCSAKNGREYGLPNTCICTVHLQYPQLRPQDRSNLSHIGHGMCKKCPSRAGEVQDGSKEISPSPSCPSTYVEPTGGKARLTRPSGENTTNSKIYYPIAITAPSLAIAGLETVGVLLQVYNELEDTRGSIISIDERGEEAAGWTRY